MTEFEDGLLKANMNDLKSKNKLCACLDFKKERVEEIVSTCEISGLFTLVKGPKCGNGDVTIWVSRREEILDILKAMPLNPKTELENFVFGKLLGFSDDAICDIISEERTKTNNHGSNI